MQRVLVVVHRCRSASDRDLQPPRLSGLGCEASDRIIPCAGSASLELRMRWKSRYQPRRSRESAGSHPRAPLASAARTAYQPALTTPGCGHRPMSHGPSCPRLARRPDQETTAENTHIGLRTRRMGPWDARAPARDQPWGRRIPSRSRALTRISIAGKHRDVPRSAGPHRRRRHRTTHPRQCRGDDQGPGAIASAHSTRGRNHP